MAEVTPAQPWHAAYPEPRSSDPDKIDRADLLQKLQAEQKSGTDFLLVDLRRTDHEGGTIRGSLNLPAQSLHGSLETLYTLCKTANIGTVIWYCGSSRGRGTRAAGWFNDLIQGQGNVHMKSIILSEGINGWATAGEEYEAFMDDFVPALWQK